MGRWIRFFIVIMIGVGLALVYSWLIAPAQYDESSLEKLRIDFKTDYVLMVAEAYQLDNDLNLATTRLEKIDDRPIEVIVKQALLFARKVDYAENDINLMESFLKALQPIASQSMNSTP